MSDYSHSWENLTKEDKDISDEDLLVYVKSFSHIYKRHGVYYKVYTPLDIKYLRKSSCIWDPKLGDPIRISKDNIKIKFKVYCGYYGLFKPSVAEVFSYIPDVNELLESGYDCWYIDNHIDIDRSGEFQIATAVFSKSKPATKKYLKYIKLKNEFENQD
jgi:hypothetical protein